MGEKDLAAGAAQEAPLLEIRDLSKGFTLHAADRRVRGCEGVSLVVRRGEFVGITGRSGSGK